LQARIRELGGTIEEFLSKDISCVVTTNKDAETRCSPRSNSTPSPILSIPSPFPGNTKSSSAKGSAVPSPLSADSGCAEQTGAAVPKHDMRGKALAAQGAITYKGGSSNVIGNAINWGVEIMSLEKMLKKLQQYGSIEKKPSSKPIVSGRVVKQGVKPKVRKLHAPFIKVEDQSRTYKPLVHELKEWPKIYFDGLLGSCPFDSPKKDLENDRQEQAKAKRKTAEEDKNKKRGYCECCCVHYEDLDKHLYSNHHQSFAKDSSNYQSLDELINKGSSLQDFLAKMLLKHEQKEKEKQDNRSKPPSAGNFLGDRDGTKTPSKQNGREVIPNCQTPPDQALEENKVCCTPTNPSPDRSHACRTPTTDSSPKKKSTDDGTPTRVLRPRDSQAGHEVEVGESRQLRTSPRLSSSSNKTSSTGKVVDSTTSKDGKKKRLSSEKTRGEKFTRQAARGKSLLTSSSPVAGSSKYGTGHLSPNDKIKEIQVNTKSFVLSVEETRAGVRTRAHEQDSSDESSGKENHNPEALATEDNVTRLSYRSRTSRVTQQRSDENRAENKDKVECHENEEQESKQEVQMENPKRTCLRSAARAGPPEHCSKNVEPRDSDVQDEPEREIHVVSPKRAFLRSAIRKNIPENHSENDVHEEYEETNAQTECAQDIQMDSPKKSNLRSAAKPSLPENCSKNGDCVQSCESNMQKQSEQDVEMESPKSTNLSYTSKEKLSERPSQNDNPVESRKEEPAEQDIHMESPKGNSGRPDTKETLQGYFGEQKDCLETRIPNVQEQPKQDIQMESPKRACLRSSTKGNLSERDIGKSDSKTPESPPHLDKKRRTRASPKTTEQHSSARITTSSEISLGNQQGTIEAVQTDSVARLTRSRVNSAPASTAKLCDASDITDKTKSGVRLSVTHESVEQEHMESRVESQDRPINCAKCEMQKNNISSSKASALEATKSTKKHVTNQSSDVVAEVEIKLPDCRQLCVIRNRPVLETESDESETESIQLSSEKTLSKDSSSENASSDGKDDDISSTPTLEYCPSPASSEKSGYSDETRLSTRYSLRKRDDPDDHDPCPGKRTRSQCKIPDLDSKADNLRDSRRRKTISSPFTSVKAKRKSSNQRSQSVVSPEKKIPEKKPKDIEREKRTSNNSPRVKALKVKDPISESDSSTFSGSPRSGPLCETRSTLASTVHLAARKLEDGTAENTEEAKDSLLLSDSVLSLGDISTTAVCGSPYHLSASLVGIKLLNGSPRIKKDFHSVTCLDKRRKERAGITRLFESDNEEEEDFIGFNVPHFDRSFSSEGDLSCKIHSIVESMDGDAGQTTLEGEENFSVQGARSGEEKIETRENFEREIETGRQANDKTIGRKRKSSQIEVKLGNSSESQSERRSTTESSSVGDDDEDDFDEDDDVFSTVADSSDGEGVEDEVASPFSISSWGRKRKSEDLQPPEIERPTKRRKSQKGTAIDHSCESPQTSRAGSPIKSGASQEMETQKENEKPTSFTSRLNELQDSEQKERAQSSSSLQDSDSFYDIDVPVYQTIEERVKLRRIRSSSQKEHENSQSLSHREHQSTEITAKGKADERLPALKPLRKETFKPLKPLKHVSPIRLSSRLNRSNSTPSTNPSPLAIPSGRSRRGTWIYDVKEFTSQRSAAQRFGGQPVTCSTPVSTISSSKLVLRPLKHGRMAEDSGLQKSRQRDVFVFDE